MINDMTKGGPLSLIFWFSVPLLIGNIFQQLYNIADIVIVGRTIGINALAAVGAISPIFFFILNLHMGVPGSAIAVVISQAISAIMCIAYVKMKFPILHLKKKDWKFTVKDKDFIYDHLKIGFPMALQFSIIGLGILVIQSVCNSFGSDVIAAMTAALRIEQIATMPMMSFGVAVAAFVAQNYGANKFKRIHEGVRKTSFVCLIISICMGFIMHFWGADIVALFLGAKDINILKIAKNYLFISALFYFFLGQIFIHRNALQGMGEPKIPLWASIIELFVRCGIAIFFAPIYGYYSVFYAGPAAWVVGASIMGFGYYTRVLRIF